MKGNDCSKVLRNLDQLEEVLPIHLSTLMATFRAVRNVVDSCFGLSHVPYYKEVCEKFKYQYKELQVKFNLHIPKKFQVITVHMAEFCQNVGRGLGEFSEQETKNTSLYLDSLLGRYRVKDVSSNVYHL